jgi:8-oxo-dGTP pyrophosphatase MutT (NUDIX family)
MSCARDAPVDSVRHAGDDQPSAVELRRLVRDHVPTDGREAASKERFLAELDRLARPCDETADPVHVTASAVVAGRRGTVLHVHRRLGRWLQPGGHIDPGESPAESEEETGLTLAHVPEGPLLIHLDVHEAARGHTHLDLRYLLVGSDDDPAPPPGESPDARWYDWESAAAIADVSLSGALEVARARWEASTGPAGDELASDELAGHGPTGERETSADG